MTNYDKLAAFVRAHRSDPLNLAKIINAWEWTSLEGGSYGPVPTGAENVPDVLAASCGWRQILMTELFKEIGIKSRAVNFYNVPFQGNHTAVELNINGKWMFFDPTFGTYFESLSGGKPLSAAEARAKWPNVVVKKATLDGWQGKFVDLASINPKTAYKTQVDEFFNRPLAATNLPFVLSAEIKSLYFGPEAGYFLDGQKTPMPASGATWITRVDTKHKAPWTRIVDTFDKNGKLDSRWGEFDTSSKKHYGWFIDWDQADKYDWAVKTTYVGNVRNAVLDYTLIVNDDKSKVLIDYDSAPSKEVWSVMTTYRTASGAMDWQTGTYDDGRTWMTDWDQAGSLPWKSFRDEYDAAGNVLTTSFIGDDGVSSVVEWSTVNTLAGTAYGDVLTGTSGRDFLKGFAGNDVLIGDTGPDRLEGGAGNDIYYTDSLEDLVIEKANGGTDTVRSTVSWVLAPNVENLVLLSGRYGTGNAEKNFIFGNAENNVLSGMAGNDHLSGQGGDDILSGGTGNDVLEGGLGADILSGNAGADVFIWRSIAETGNTASTADLVRDFSFAQGDRLNLSAIDANRGVAGNQAFKFIGSGAFTGAGQIKAVQVDGETRILLNVDSNPDVDAVIRLSGLKAVDASWFVL
ncbi:calcium-binding protein [Microvirga antarctica]|uniref:calcium-binding protein n=1 Tax=Microvirga antarctica TaxID=2819233 RepID=UPI001B3062CD|nr:calcium-binding protein [Microvirga antarctica]